MTMIQEKLRTIDWSAYTRPVIVETQAFLKKYPKQILAVFGGAIVLSTLLFYSTPTQRLKVFGRRLIYEFRPDSTLAYLVSLNVENRVWSERGGRMDTPMATVQKNETANVEIHPSAFHDQEQQLRLQPREWIVNQRGQIVQNLALSHPSLKPATVTLSREGRVTTIKRDLSARSGRTLTFLTPSWPKTPRRVGDQWQEPIQWVEGLGDWKILWKGELRWTLKGLKEYDGQTCAYLVYTTRVTPSIWSVPEWAKGGVQSVTFNGSGSGEVYFDLDRHRVVSSDFVLEGELAMPIDNIYRVPDELRVGRVPRRRHGRPLVVEPGVIKIDVKNAFGVRKA